MKLLAAWDNPISLLVMEKDKSHLKFPSILNAYFHHMHLISYFQG